MTEKKLPGRVGSIAVNATQAAREIGVSRRTFVDILARGEIPAKKCGHLTLVAVDDLRSYIASLPAAKYAAPKRRQPSASQ